GLFHDFPADPVAWDVADQFLFGPDVLVAPGVTAGARSREVYLPAGARWVDAATGEEHDGGRWLTVAAPLDVVPAVLRAGTLPHLVGSTAGARYGGGSCDLPRTGQAADHTDVHQGDRSNSNQFDFKTGGEAPPRNDSHAA